MDVTLASLTSPDAVSATSQPHGHLRPRTATTDYQGGLIEEADESSAPIPAVVSKITSALCESIGGSAPCSGQGESSDKFVVKLAEGDRGIVNNDSDKKHQRYIKQVTDAVVEVVKGSASDKCRVSGDGINDSESPSKTLFVHGGGSSSESESVSGGDSSDDDLFIGEDDDQAENNNDVEQNWTAGRKLVTVRSITSGGEAGGGNGTGVIGIGLDDNGRSGNIKEADGQSCRKDEDSSEGTATIVGEGQPHNSSSDVDGRAILALTSNIADAGGKDIIDIGFPNADRNESTTCIECQIGQVFPERREIGMVISQQTAGIQPPLPNIDSSALAAANKDEKYGKGTASGSDLEWGSGDDSVDLVSTTHDGLKLPGSLDAQLPTPCRPSSFSVNVNNNNSLGRPQQLSGGLHTPSVGPEAFRAPRLFSEKEKHSPSQVLSLLSKEHLWSRNPRTLATAGVEKVFRAMEPPSVGIPSPSRSPRLEPPYCFTRALPGGLPPDDNNFERNFDSSADYVAGEALGVQRSMYRRVGSFRSKEPLLESFSMASKPIGAKKRAPRRDEHHEIYDRHVSPISPEDLSQKAAQLIEETETGYLATSGIVCRDPRTRLLESGTRNISKSNSTVEQKSSPFFAAGTPRKQGRRQRNGLSPTSFESAAAPTATGINEDITAHSNSVTRYANYFPRFAAILSAYHNGRALTRESDSRTLALTSTILSRGSEHGIGGTTRGVGGPRLTAVEEEASFHLQWKLYAIYVRVIKVRDVTTWGLLLGWQMLGGGSIVRKTTSRRELVQIALSLAPISGGGQVMGWSAA